MSPLEDAYLLASTLSILSGAITGLITWYHMRTKHKRKYHEY